MEGEASEEIVAGFMCTVCMDVLYKPAVLACGHAFCFWCCQRSMGKCVESHCPLCRHSYNHFPAICRSLHFLLKKLYPASYSERETELEEGLEDDIHGISPQIDDPVSTQELNNAGKFSINDVLCVACNQLLYRPAVLNCGHVYCQGCITIPTEGMLKCQVCECRHPCGLPKVCQFLDNFLEERFSAEYEVRKSAIQQNQMHTQTASSSNEAGAQIPNLSFPTRENFIQWWTVNRSRLHANVGCDMCGMFPIIGDRYQCQECPKNGYDLCGDCYPTSSTVSGRFHHTHNSTHRLESVRPTLQKRIMYRILARRLAPISALALNN